MNCDRKTVVWAAAKISGRLKLTLRARWSTHLRLHATVCLKTFENLLRRVESLQVERVHLKLWRAFAMQWRRLVANAHALRFSVARRKTGGKAVTFADNQRVRHTLATLIAYAERKACEPDRAVGSSV